MRGNSLLQLLNPILPSVMSSGARTCCACWLGHVCACACREQNRYLKSLAFGKTKEFVHVDMHAKMTEKGLVNLFPVVCWPETKAVAEVATKLDKWKKQGVPVHFVFVELRKCAVFVAFAQLVALCAWVVHVRWLPTHCSDHEVVALNEEDFPDADKARKQFNRRFLDMSVWMMAWDRYALGATILGQMAFVDTQNHKAVVEEVPCLCECSCGAARIGTCMFADFIYSKQQGQGPIVGCHLR